MTFSCKQCGECCHIPGKVYFDKDDIYNAAVSLNIDPERFMEKYLRHRHGKHFIRVDKDGCPLLRDNKCSVQGGKPKQCSTYPYWPEYTDKDGKLIRIDRKCIGID